jgi:hypothetical protein
MIGEDKNRHTYRYNYRSYFKSSSLSQKKINKIANSKGLEGTDAKEDHSYNLLTNKKVKLALPLSILMHL